MSELIEALLVLSRISRHTLHRENRRSGSMLSPSIVLQHRQKDPMRAIEVTVHPDMPRSRRSVACPGRPLPEPDRERMEVHLEHPVRRASRSGGFRTAPTATLFVGPMVGFDMTYEKKLFKPFQRLDGSGGFRRLRRRSCNGRTDRGSARRSDLG